MWLTELAGFSFKMAFLCMEGLNLLYVPARHSNGQVT
ncbi:hypothetical protein VINI7043_11051 [Vibrio nigripulchritudo ATCC 27043]|nr:hypothetical protein VINI7043_11051 [Vibrio nigripulchritudo ATCC 27043]